MSQTFVKGRTNNHLTWVMVDSTDFATPESALSAATKIKIYGKVRGGAGVNFVSSGTGSLTNDITHVGASALGIYSIGLAKADLSDASNAWYDQYIISLSATGAAYQVLVVDGGIDASALSALQSRLSDIQSYLVALSGLVSDVHSQALLGTSAASDAYSAALIIQSRLSDLDGRLVSDLSDVLSMLTVNQSLASDAHSAAAAGASRALINQSRISDVQSFLTAMSDALSDAHSDLASKIAGITATVGASDISDIASAVQIILSDTLSNILSAAAQTNSRVILIQSRLSDLDSRLASDLSDVLSGIVALSAAVSDTHSAATAGASRALINQSRISDVASYLVALSDALSDAHSDLKSAIGGITVTIGASDVSDIASAVLAGMTFGSTISDIYSLLSDLNSNFNSRIPLEPAGRSQLSDLASDVKSNALLIQSRLSDFDSRLVSELSDVLSQLTVIQSMASDAASAAQQGNSRLLVNQSRVSDVYSLLSDLESSVGLDATGGINFRNFWETGGLVNGGWTLASQFANLTAGRSAAQQTNSRALVNQSRVSDIYSLLSDVQSDFQSRVPKRVATDSQLSDLHSDLRSHVVGLSASVSDMQSALSDAHSDLKSAIGGITVSLDASNISDIASAVVAGLPITSMVSDVYSLAQAIHAKTQLIGANTTLTFTAPYVDDDGIIQGIIQGDDLKAADGRAVSVSIPLEVCDLTGATAAVMKIQRKDVNGVASGSVDSTAYTISGAGTDDQAIAFDFARADTVNLTPELCLVDVEMTLASGNKATRQFQADVARQVA